jgi:hypothetical protein
VLGLFATTGLARQFHQATARHAICPDHGEAIHVGGHDDQEHDPEAIAGSADSADGRPMLSSATDPSEHEHEHCLLCSTSRERVSLAPRGHAASSLPGLAAGAAPDESVQTVAHPPPVPTYLFAPKHSPPIA